MNTITRREIEAICLAGDVIAVEYLKKDAVAEAIAFAEHGLATHALCCMGGLDIVEATALGVAETSLHNYLRGNTRLTIRTAAPTPEQAKLATDFWDARVLDPYDWGQIFGLGPIFLLQHLLWLLSPRAGNWVLRTLPNLFASSHLNTCAELAARGVKESKPTAFTAYPIENMDPEVLRTHPSLTTKRVLDGAVLVG